MEDKATRQGQKRYLHSIHLTWSRAVGFKPLWNWPQWALIALLTKIRHWNFWNPFVRGLYLLFLMQVSLISWTSLLSTLLAYRLALGEWHIHHSLSTDKTNPLFNLFKNKQSFSPHSYDLIGMFGGLITKGRMSTCKISIRSISSTPGSWTFFFLH